MGNILVARQGEQVQQLFWSDVGDMATLQVDMVNKTATCGPGVRDIISKLPDGLLFPCGHCNGVPLGGYLKMLGGGFGAQNTSCFFAFVELIYL
jgi:hypothetical protein